MTEENDNKKGSLIQCREMFESDIQTNIEMQAVKLNNSGLLKVYDFVAQLIAFVINISSILTVLKQSTESMENHTCSLITFRPSVINFGLVLVLQIKFEARFVELF